MQGWIIPYRTPFLFPLIYPSLVWRIPNAPRELYLTFDDGPVSGPTDFVLETLDRFSAKATFFCIGDNVRKHPDVFKKVLRRGHAVGNHTFNHLNGWKTPGQKYLDNIRQCTAEMDKHLQPSSRLFRPPYGRISRSQITALSASRIIMWDVLSMDFNKDIPGEASLRKTINASRDGSIIVFHDSFKAEKKLQHMLPRFMDHFAQQGYAFKAIAL
jgi:peptidoglycan/xylan/chitin deacetylase (PgdA/CDA1 family)